jgi:KamA family protein
MRLEIADRIDHPLLLENSGYLALDSTLRKDMHVVSKVFPFRVNKYVLENLIDWNDPKDPIFRMTFPNASMLSEEQFDKIALALKANNPEILAKAVHNVRMELNPHPAGQTTLNVPMLKNGRRIRGIQHKYSQTVLFFPSQGQTCHSYCTFCFRWPQFTNDTALHFACSEANLLIEYIKEHPEISDILITGGDPMVMRTKVLSAYLKAICQADLPQIRSIRIGTKAFTYWPFRFTTDPDSAELIDCFKEVQDTGRHLSLVAHFNHPKELKTPATIEAIAKVRACGVTVRAQSPLLKGINDSSRILSDLWTCQMELGCIPYYLFILRDTGPREYYSVPLARCYDLYSNAIQSLSGLARTVRGPVMSAEPGKIAIRGISDIMGKKVFVLQFLQARDPMHSQRIFYANYDARARWIDELTPAFSNDSNFFYENKDFLNKRQAVA